MAASSAESGFLQLNNSMRSTFYGLEIAKTGLFGAQNALELTGHNISNADTAGYTRQRLHTSSIPPSYGGTFIAVDHKTTAGRGVTTVHIEQVRNSFLDYQYRKENSTTSKYAAKEQYFEYIESLFNNELDDIATSTGISKMFSRFYDALYELSENPEKQEIRTNLQENAKALTETMNYYSTRLQEQQQTLNECVRIAVSDINSLADQIADLNKQIYGFEMDGSKANDLRDQRNVLLDELSGMIDITTYEDVNGQLVVELGGKNLVRHTTTTKLSVKNDTEFTLYNGDARATVVWADRNGDPTEAEVKFTDGALKGYMEVRDGNDEHNIGINHVIRELDKLCQKVAKDINDVHQKGWTMPGTAHSESRTGILFFDVPQATDEGGNLLFDEENKPILDYSQITAGNFRISDDIRDDYMNIAASDNKIGADDENGDSVTNDQKGNGKNALAMCGVIANKDDLGNPDNIDGRYKTLLSMVSIEMDSIHNNATAQTVMQNHIDDQRRSITDVSLDEEMTNVIRFGHAYNAASRVITAIDEELEKLINGTGRVGL